MDAPLAEERHEITNGRSSDLVHPPSTELLKQPRTQQALVSRPCPCAEFALIQRTKRFFDERPKRWRFDRGEISTLVCLRKEPTHAATGLIGGYARRVFNWLANQHFMGRGMPPEGAEYHEGYIGEYPWAVPFTIYPEQELAVVWTTLGEKLVIRAQAIGAPRIEFSRAHMLDESGQLHSSDLLVPAE